MVPALTTVTCLITLLITLVLPVVVIVLLCRKHPGEKLFSAWFWGAMGFFVTQMVIRVPILAILQSQSWFAAFAQNSLFLYAFLLAFTAGLFELAGRFVVAKILSKNLTYRRSLAAGLGHGGIESMLLVGVSYIANLLFIFTINNGTLDMAIAELANIGTDVSGLIQIQETMIQSSPVLFLLAGYERILTIIAHSAMSMIVCYSMYRGKPLQGALLCLGIHTFLDLTAGIQMLNPGSQGLVYGLIYGILTLMAIISILIIVNIRRRWKEKEVNYESERA